MTITSSHLSCATGTAACRGSNTDEVVTWKGAVSQKLARDVMVFGSVARGYKGYAFDIVTGFNPARINAALNGTGPGLIGVGPIKPETSTSYELGVKSRFLNNRLQLNVIGFNTDYYDFQAQSASCAPRALSLSCRPSQATGCVWIRGRPTPMR